MSCNFDGKTIAITGSGAGIGRATATLLAERGAKVACISLYPEELYSLSQDIMKNPRCHCRPLTYAGDVTDASFVRNVFDDLERNDYGLHGLVNNAAAFYFGSPETITREEWSRVTDTNQKAPFYVSMAAMPLLLRNGGSIVNIGSIEGIRGGNSSTCYAASKGALGAITRDLAVRYGPEGIKTNAVLPGNIATENDRKRIFSREGGEEGLKEFIKRVPLRRSGEPEEVAKLVAFLLSDESSYINGTSIVIDGGYSVVL